MKTELEKIANITLENKDGKLHYEGSLDLEGTQITSLPDNLDCRRFSLPGRYTDYRH